MLRSFFCTNGCILAKMAHFFSEIFRETFLKILTSYPGHFYSCCCAISATKLTLAYSTLVRSSSGEDFINVNYNRSLQQKSFLPNKILGLDDTKKQRWTNIYEDMCNIMLWLSVSNTIWLRLIHNSKNKIYIYVTSNIFAKKIGEKWRFWLITKS
jgi:hypothetical protein